MKEATLRRIAEWAEIDAQREARRRHQFQIGEYVQRQQDEKRVRDDALANNRRAASTVDQLLRGGRVVPLDPPGVEIDPNVDQARIDPHYDEVSYFERRIYLLRLFVINLFVDVFDSFIVDLFCF